MGRAAAKRGGEQRGRLEEVGELGHRGTRGGGGPPAAEVEAPVGGNGEGPAERRVPPDRGDAGRQADERRNESRAQFTAEFLATA